MDRAYVPEVAGNPAHKQGLEGGVPLRETVTVVAPKTESNQDSNKPRIH